MDRLIAVLPRAHAHLVAFDVGQHPERRSLRIAHQPTTGSERRSHSSVGLVVCHGDIHMDPIALRTWRVHLLEPQGRSHPIGIDQFVPLRALRAVRAGIAHIHTQRLREKLLRHNAAVTGHRLLRGGVGVGSAQWATEPDLALVAEVAAEVAEIVALTLDHSVVLDRFTGTAVLPGELARNLGTLGYVARASGLTVDARADHPQVALGPGFTPVAQEGGDVLARYAVRASEFAASAALLPLLTELAAVGGEGPVGAMGLGGERTAYGRPDGEGSGPAAGLGVVEAWRGTLCHRVELGPDGRLTRVKIVDPSFFNWPGLPVALADTIVPDFPLANKSFNQSYAGNDL